MGYIYRSSFPLLSHTFFLSFYLSLFFSLFFSLFLFMSLPPKAMVALERQYRMCEDIMQLSNMLIYGFRMRCADASVAQARLAVPRLSAVLERCTTSTSLWLVHAVQPANRVIFFNTDTCVGLSWSRGRIHVEELTAHSLVDILGAQDHFKALFYRRQHLR